MLAFALNQEKTEAAKLLEAARIMDALYQDNLLANPKDQPLVEGGFEAAVKRLIRKSVEGSLYDLI